MAECKDYSQTRYSFNPKRKIVWEEISRYLATSYLPPVGRALELGCGYGDWLGCMAANEKVAIEFNANLAESARCGYGLDVHQGDVFSLLPDMDDNSFDLVLASNFFEHFDVEAVSILLTEALRTLKPDGKLLVIQPNFRYCSKMYFDDFTHRSVHSHVSFGDLLASLGFKVIGCEPRFLPFSFKSRLPVSRTLVRAYLNSPIKPMGAQFLICAQPDNK